MFIKILGKEKIHDSFHVYGLNDIDLRKCIWQNEFKSQLCSFHSFCTNTLGKDIIPYFPSAMGKSRIIALLKNKKPLQYTNYY